MVRSMGGEVTGRERLGAAIFALLLGIFALRAFVDTPGLSLVFLAVFPVVMAAFVLGRTAAVACAAIATALSIVVPIINPTSAPARRSSGRSAAERSTSGWPCSSPRCSSARRSCASPWPNPSASARSSRACAPP
jgi:hypothetical protein